MTLKFTITVEGVNLDELAVKEEINTVLDSSFLADLGVTNIKTEIVE